MCDIKWDEDCGGARHPNNIISIPDKGGLHQSTRNYSSLSLFLLSLSLSGG